MHLCPAKLVLVVQEYLLWNQPQKVEFLHCLVGPVNCGLDMQAVDLYVIQVGKGSFPQHTVENSHIAEVTLSPRSNSQEAIL